MTISFLNKLYVIHTPMILVLVLILAIGGSVTAQDSSRVESKNVPELFKPLKPALRPQKPKSTEQVQRLELARRLISQKKYSDAITVLENLRAAGNNTANIETLLVTCYIRSNNHPMAEKMLQVRVLKNPLNMNLKVQLAEQLWLLNRTEESERQYSQAMELIDSGQTRQLDFILLSMIKLGIEDRALTIIDSVRETNNDHMLFALRRGAVFERRGNYTGAAKEYYQVLDRDTTHQAAMSERKLLFLLDFPASTNQVESTLLEQVRLTGNQAVLRLLNSHYIKAGQFDLAYELTIQQDSVLIGSTKDLPDDLSPRPQIRRNVSRASLLLQFILQCLDRGEQAQVIRMADYMLATQSNNSFALQASLHKADALKKLNRHDEAIATYVSTFNQTQDIPGQADILYRIGDVYLNGLGENKNALIYFDSVVVNYQRGTGFLNSLQTRPVCYFRIGEMSRAADAFRQLFTRFQAEKDMERQEFYLALIDLAVKHFDSSAAKLEKLVVTHPNGMYVNDAIELLMLFKQSDEKPGLRKELFEATIYEWRRLHDSTRIALDQIVSNQDNSMADFALYRLAILETELGNDTAAVAAADKLINGFEDSYYMPIALKIKADVLAENENDAPSASLLYRRILSDFPNFPFSTQVRKALRALENDSQNSEANQS